MIGHIHMPNGVSAFGYVLIKGIGLPKAVRLLGEVDGKHDDVA